MPGLRRFNRPKKITQAAMAEKTAGRSLGFVPTMGALHEGHCALIRAARKACDRVIVSIFVNPTQFGPNEDFKHYPRDLKRDTRLAREAGADWLFVPTTETMYPRGWQTVVAVKGLGEILEGASRPGHFDGVCTVVSQLLHSVQPDVLFLGQKDYQQVCVLKRMIEDLHLPIKVRMCPTVREADGLALSSRNVYLSPQEREAAAGIPAALDRAAESLRGGQRNVARLEAQLHAALTDIPGSRVEYARCVDAETLQPLQRAGGRCVILVALWLGKTRLIDNRIFNVS